MSGPTTAPTCPRASCKPELQAVTESPRGVREHGVTGGIADRLTCPLGEDQGGGQFPADGQGKQRHGRHVQAEADEGDQPILSRAVGEITGEEAEAVIGQLAQPGDDPNDGGTCPERGEV